METPFNTSKHHLGADWEHLVVRPWNEDNGLHLEWTCEGWKPELTWNIVCMDELGHALYSIANTVHGSRLVVQWGGG